MPSTEALVSVRIVKVEEVDWARLNEEPLRPNDRPYLIAKITHRYERFFGRTPRWPDGKTSITMPIEAYGGAWCRDVSFTAGDAVEIIVEAWVDRGDEAPRKLASTFHSIYYHKDDPLVALQEERVSEDPENGIQVRYEMKIRPVPPPRLSSTVARSMSDALVENHLELGYTVVTRISQVHGLYKPIGGSKPTSVAKAGYISSDDEGRIFVNQDHLGQSLNGDQWIQVRAEATFINADIPIGKVTMKWAIIIYHDDPSNDLPHVHREAGQLLDPKDYDQDGEHIGGIVADNEGFYASPLFVACDGFDIVKFDKEAFTAVTEIKRSGSDLKAPVHSEVRIKCPGVAGDRFSVQAVLVVENHGDAKDNPHVFPASTGIMTMWKRIPVRVFKMKSAFALNTASVASEYTACMVQLDFGEPEEQDDVKELSSFPGGADRYLLNIAGPPTYPPTFVLLLALHHTVVEKRPLNLIKDHLTQIITIPNTSDGKGFPCEAVKVPGDMSQTAGMVTINWMTDGVPCKATFSVQGSTTKDESTFLYLRGHDVTREFTGADSDGSSMHAHKTQFHAFVRGFVKNGQWEGGGYGGPEDVTVSVQAKGGMPTSGLSPFSSVGGKNYFAGRTIVFTHHGAYDANFGKEGAPVPRETFAAAACATLVHEFCHAFGMPHKCAYWDYKTPREKSCCMNYSTTWIMNQANAFIATSINKVGSSMCGRHIKEVRRVLLHKNPVYRHG